MPDINVEVGRRIRNFRKMRGMTIVDLARQICKSKATVSKYEKGEIALDVVTLYEIARALRVRVEQLLYTEPESPPPPTEGKSPAFFHSISQFYSYLFDGRSGQLIRSVFDISHEPGPSGFQIMMYMNIRDYEQYQNCENTYWGCIEHYDALTKIVMKNQSTPMEQVSINILASFMDTSTKWGLFVGISSRPMMPIAAKMLFSRTVLPEDEALTRQLKVSREDIRLLKLYNMFSVI